MYASRSKTAAILGLTLISSPIWAAQPLLTPGVTIVDSSAKVVGRLVDGNSVLLQVPGGQWVAVPVGIGGFALKSNRFAFYNDAPGCKGTWYLADGATGLPAKGSIINDAELGAGYYYANTGTLIYPTNVKVITAYGVNFFPYPPPKRAAGCAQSFPTPQPRQAGAAVSVSVPKYTLPLVVDWTVSLGH